MIPEQTKDERASSLIWDGRIPDDKALRHELLSNVLARSIAAQIVELRLRNGLSQQQFAKGIGCYQSTVSVWESGRYRGWSTKTLFRIAQFFDVALILQFSGWREWAMAFTPFGPHPVPLPFNRAAIVRAAKEPAHD